MEILNVAVSVAVIVASIVLIVNLTLTAVALWRLWSIDRLRHKTAKLEFRIEKIIEAELKKIEKEEEKEKE